MKEKYGMLIGLTGQTGAGKSTVGAYLKRLGHAVLDADAASRQAAAKGGEGLRRLASAFGEEILLPDGSLDRKRLGRIVFADPEKKKLLESILFPLIFKIVDEETRRLFAGGAPAVFLDAPTLFESGADQRCDCVISVIAPEPLRFSRIMARDGISRHDAQLRLRAQPDDEFYTSRSRFVLVNDGSEEALFAQADAALAQLGLEVIP